MKCPNCGGADLQHGKQDIPYTYKGESTVFEGIEGDYCPNCGEGIHGEKEGDRLSQLMLAFNKKVNTATYDPAFILTVRRKLGLDQREAGELFGGGKNAFSRYETGDTQPPVSLVKLFTVLDRHPELLTEIRAG
ncbi:type II toxin-antitoxin system MqsA family antitoxin [Burkholderia gladioli]|uniref:type II toxin-antitoxin system MqsA family antitoxin n=1 Tax=Burkholderia gladioli TaxID=28095 RepID=UPI002861FFA2|nr:type II toxin-antitoxin system MqsA family antitoxin [Burkholderia gladioli]MDR8093107.1 type II toxin-antitoxin system MqsA family antitoxin [Burkholderia gladioli]